MDSSKDRFVENSIISFSYFTFFLFSRRSFYFKKARYVVCISRFNNPHSSPIQKEKRLVEGKEENKKAMKGIRHAQISCFEWIIHSLNNRKRKKKMRSLRKTFKINSKIH